MDFSDVLAARHSVRRFSDEPVSRETVDEIIDEARLAPSSRNSKSTGFMIVEDPSTIEALSEMRDHGSAFMAKAQTVLVVLGDSDKTDLWVENCSISATYLMLSAAARGLGSCWVHVNGRPRVKEDPSKGGAEDYVRELLGVKDNMRILCLIALGYEAPAE